jgi:UDP-glucuronate decarboxylase
MNDTPDDFIGPINIGNPNEFTIKELAEKVVSITATKSKFVIRDLPADDPRQRQPDISLANRIINWSPVVELEEGLEKTVDYFRKIVV